MNKQIYLAQKFILVYLLSLSTILFGKPKLEYWNELNYISAISDNKEKIKALKNLLFKYEKESPSGDSLTAKIYHILGRTYWYDNELDFGVYFTKKSIEINQKKSEQSKAADLANSYYNLSKIYSEKNDFRTSLEYLDKCIYISKKYKEKYYLVSTSFSAKANLYLQLGDYERCIQMADLGIYHAKIDKNNVNISINFLEKAQGELGIGRGKKALISFENAISIIKLTNDKILEANNYSLFAEYQLKIGKPTEALKYFKKAFEIFHSKNDQNQLVDKYGCFQSLSDIGYAYKQLNQYKNALLFYEKATEFATSGYEIARIFNNIGEVQKKLQNHEKAFNYFQMALIETPIGFKNNNIFSNPSPKMFKYSTNKEYLLSIFIDKANCWVDYYKFKNDKYKLNNAIKTFELASNLIDYMRNDHLGNESKYFWRNKTRPVYEAAIETCFLLKDYQKAFYFFEKSRSVLLNDKLNEIGANQKLSIVDQQKENDLQRKIMELNTQIEGEKDEKRKEIKNTELLDLQEAQAQFVKSLEEKNPAYYAMKYDTNVATLTNAQQYLKTNFKGKPATLVEYFVGDSATYALVISANKVALKKLNFNPKLASQFLELSSKSIQTKTELNTFLSSSKGLYDQIIKPLSIAKGHLIISQDGVFLPFEALSIAEKNAQYLINDYAISYTYSAQILLKNKSETTFAPNRNFIGFAPVNFQKLASLMGSKKSISNINSHYILGKNLIEKEANKNAFLAQASKYQIVQLYTHAVADSNDTEPSIYFADSSLKVSELSAENHFKTNLLVLSACKTGVGKLAKGEGVLSLARGFSMVGIPSTITSLWSVEDIDTYTVTELFYKYLNKGFAKDEALQKAKIEFMQNQQNAMPNQWAGLVLVGESSQLNPSKYLQYFIGIFALIIVAIIIYRKRMTLKLPFQF